MIKQDKAEPRKDYLIRVAIAFIERNDLGAHTIEYDGVLCDGYCLQEDLKNAGTGIE